MSQDSSRPVLALIGDVDASRRASGSARVRIQGELLAVLEELNREHAPALLAPLTLTAGDEVQAVLKRPTAAVELVRALSDRMFEAPATLGFGLGYGPLTTPIDAGPRPNPAHLDGPCFHAARASLEVAKDRGAWAACSGFGPREDRVLSSLFELMGAIRIDWTERQSQSTVLTRALGQQKAAAERMGISPSVVSKSLKAAKFDAILAGEDAARAVLERLDPEPA